MIFFQPCSFVKSHKALVTAGTFVNAWLLFHRLNLYPRKLAVQMTDTCHCMVMEDDF